MEFAFDLGLGGWTLLVAGALVFGAILQFIGTAETGWEWLVDAIAAFAGAVVASEFVIAWQAFAPHAPCTPPPGCADAEARNSPRTGVSGRPSPGTGRKISCWWI